LEFTKQVWGGSTSIGFKTAKLREKERIDPQEKVVAGMVNLRLGGRGTKVKKEKKRRGKERRGEEEVNTKFKRKILNSTASDQDRNKDKEGRAKGGTREGGSGL